MIRTKTRRYVLSWGLAFAEKNEMAKLGKLAQKGWFLQSFAFLGYFLRKAEPQNLVYELDYQNVKPADMEEYIDTFTAAGWSYVCSAGEGMHIFSAAPGTAPIYSDRQSANEKYNRITKSAGMITVMCIILMLIGYGVSSLIDSNSGYIESALQLLGSAGLTIAFPAFMTYCAFLIRKNIHK